MELRRLRYFVAVAKSGNFRRAAEQLNIAQSALSRHVTLLEQELGGSLLNRNSSGTTTTQLGQAFYHDAVTILEHIDGAVERSRNVLSGKIGRLVIGVNELGANNPLIARCVTRFHQQYPDVKLVFKSMYSIDQVFALRNDDLDAGILAEMPRTSSEFELTVIGIDRVAVALPQDHHLAGQKVLKPADLQGQHFIGLHFDRYAYGQSKLLQSCKELGLEPEFTVEAANEQMQLALIRQGLGIGFVNRSASGGQAPGIALRPLHGLDFGLRVDLVWKQSNINPALVHFRDIVISECRSL